jgi:hypothetical protein
MPFARNRLKSSSQISVKNVGRRVSAGERVELPII